MSSAPGGGSHPPPDPSPSQKPSAVVYRCPIHALPYGAGYSCPRCTSNAQVDSPGHNAVSTLASRTIRALSQLSPGTLRRLATVMVILMTWLAYRALRTEIIVGGDTRFKPSVECRTKCAEISEKQLRPCPDELCRSRALAQLGACENGCNAAHPHAVTPLDFTYAWGKPPEWLFVWAALAGNAEFSKCFESEPLPVALRMRVNAAGILQNLAFSVHSGMSSERKEVCMTSALQGQNMPPSKGEYVYAVSSYDLAKVDLAAVRQLLEKRLGKATEDDDPIAAARAGEALSQVKSAEVLRKERREAAAQAEKKKQRDATRSDDSPYPRATQPPWDTYRTPDYYSYPQPSREGDRAKGYDSAREAARDSRASREHIREVEREVERMRQARIDEEQENRERVQQLNMQREYLNAVKQRMQQRPDPGN